MLSLVIKAILLWPVAIVVQIATWGLAYFIAIPFRIEPRKDHSKRLSFERGEDRYTEYIFQRQYLLKIFAWAGSDDNAIDEYYYGMFGMEETSLKRYQESWWHQYRARVFWIQRNPAMKFNRDVLGIELDGTEVLEKKRLWNGKAGLTVWKRPHPDGYCHHAFMLEADLGIFLLKNIKWGWKGHRSAQHALMYADRILSTGQHRDSKWFKQKG